MLEVILLVFFRIVFFIAFSPVLSSRTFPAVLKVALAIFLTIISLNTISITSLPELTWGVTFLFLLLKEMMLGFAMGFIGQLMFTAVEIAGQLIDFQVGFSMAQVYDTTFQISGSQYGKLNYWLATCVFFITNLHHQLIRGIVESFILVPVGTVTFPGVTIEGIVKVFSQTIEMAVNLAAPIVIALLVIDLILGILARTVPQINLLLLSLPLKTGVSFFFALLLLPNIASFLNKILPTSIQFIQEMLHSFS